MPLDPLVLVNDAEALVARFYDGQVAELSRWQSVTASGAVLTMFATDLLTGFLIAWLYAAVRPRLGAGLMTAITTGLAVWALLFLQGHIPEYVWIPRFREATVLTSLAGVIQFTVAAAVAGWVYAEAGDRPAARAGKGRAK